MPTKVLSNAIVIGSLVLVALASTPALAQVCGPDPDGRLANAVYRDTTIVWEPIVEYERMVLTIAGPCEDIIRVFRRGEPIFFDIREIERVQDGAYTWELRREAAIDTSTQKELARARALGDDSIWWDLWQSGAIPQGPYVESAPFLVANGVIVPPGQQEEKNGPLAKAETQARPVTSVALAPLSSMPAASKRPRPSTAADQVIPDDLIVQGSLCVGFDCVNNENFSFDTIRLKENNLRIHFDDTSTTTGFPANDWRLIANDSASGGSSKFSIEDSTGAKTPFTIRAGAATNSIFVDSTGRVGFRTATPVLDLHVNTGNTPAIRLEQNNSGGFTAQTWDVAGNEANFFVRDVTGGSKLPFRIRPGAATSAIDIAADSQVGIGTASPSDKLHVKIDDVADLGVTIDGDGITTDLPVNLTLKGDSASFFIQDLQGTANQRIVQQLLNADTWRTRGLNDALAETVDGVVLSLATGNVGINCESAPAADLVVDDGGACNAGTRSELNAGAGTFTVLSSRSVKEHLAPVKVEGILDKMSQIQVYSYDFIDGPEDRIGLMAEDFHTIFGRGSDKKISGDEIQLALWLAVQELSVQNDELRRKSISGDEAQLALSLAIQELSAQNDELRREIEKLKNHR